MGREVRLVRADWTSHSEPLFDGLMYFQHLTDWLDGRALFEQGLRRDWADPTKLVELSEAAKQHTYEEWEGDMPDPDDYTDTRPGDDLTHIVMYENTSEGTPISPKFPNTPEGEKQLASWLADTGASAFGHQGAPYESWLAMIQRGDHAISMVITEGRIMSGVEYAGRCATQEEE